VFESGPPPEVGDEDAIDEEDLEIGGEVIHGQAVGEENEFEREFGGVFGGNHEVGKGSMPQLKRTPKGKSRRDSVAPWIMAGKLPKMLGGSEISDEGGDVSKRLEALEKATARIEKILRRLCEELTDGTESITSPELGDTGR
jgi:hypothetical protein